MKKYRFLFLTVCLLFIEISSHAQETSASNNISAKPATDRTVFFDVSAEGEDKPIIWGLDLAWLSESNVRRGLSFMGSERVGIIRSSFTPTAALVDGELPEEELGRLNERLGIIDLLGEHTVVGLNCDHPSVDAWYVGNAANWAKLIDVTVRHHQERGRTVVTVSPFNEPDYTATGQGTIADFYNIAGELKNNPRFDNIRISGGNTLNDDQALTWYNYLKERLDEGNTHQLAGDFDHYAEFYQQVRANGHHATNDELHNVMEAMVGVEYGMQTGIWWGTAELARGEFVKASFGKRLGYAEHRPNWTAASVYHSPEGKLQAFGGASERQAATTSYRFVSKERDVYYDGYGPMREYVMEIPGGTGYQVDQPNAERVVNITWGDDIQPIIDGKYVVVNRASGKVLEVANGNSDSGANIQQSTAVKDAKYQQWSVTPVDSRIGGDFSYFLFTAEHCGKSLDVLNWSLESGDNIIMWDEAKGANQQWYLEYVEDGWFYIRSRHSANCLGNPSAGTDVRQWKRTDDEALQWRFLPVDAAVEFDAPNAPANLTAEANAASVVLAWAANSENDLASYTIFRSDVQGGEYNMIARGVTSTSFVDHTALVGTQYHYVIKAMDNSLNSSAYSNEVAVGVTGEQALVANYDFEETMIDGSINLNHSDSYGGILYEEGKVGSNAVSLNGIDAFVQLPSTVSHHQEMTIATWVYWKGGDSWQRVFDFGNGESETMFLTACSDENQLQFCISAGGSEQNLYGEMLTKNEWSQVAITISQSEMCMYVNGELVDKIDEPKLSHMDFKPVLNYIGRSQYADDPLFYGIIDDFQIYNYAMDVEGIKSIDKSVSLQGLTVNGEEWNIDDVYTFGCNGDESILVLDILTNEGVLVRDADDNVLENNQLEVSHLNEAGDYAVSFSLLRDGDLDSAVYFTLNARKLFSFNAVVAKRWGNVLVVNNNSASNGGYKFTSYAWYKDGKLVSNSQYYTAGQDGRKLDENAVFQVKLTTVERQELKTCESTVQLGESLIEVYPTQVERGQQFNVETKYPIDAVVNVYDMNGVMINSRNTQGNITKLSAPNMSGIYLVQINSGGYMEQVKIVVK